MGSWVRKKRGPGIALPALGGLLPEVRYSDEELGSSQPHTNQPGIVALR